MTRPGPGFTATLISWLGLGLVAFLAIWLQQPPAALPATAGAAEFSAERAFQHVEAIARSPRPIGSASHAAARDYIFQQLRAFGLEPEIQKATALNSTAAPLFFAGTIQNIVARQKGAGDGRAVALVAHYDSVSTGPGANDDGTGVATLLETARALSVSGQQLRNDIIFLFTDSEETGLLGARAFVAEHTWAKEVEVALNFEGRGNGGPVIMFETSPQNGALIRALAKATSYPLANSLSYEIYKRLPNDTDMTVFKTAGVPGMNFAYIDGLTHYHTQLDNLENVDARTLQHHGSNALALSRHFGATVSAAKPEGDAIYFNALGFLLVRYPAWLAWPVTLGTLLLLGAVIWLGFRRKELTGTGIVKGALLFFASLIAAGGAVWSAWWLVRRIHPGYSLITHGDSYSHGLYVLGFVALTLAIAAATLGALGRRISGANLFVGALLWWAALMVAVTVSVIGGSYLLTWPLLFALLGLGFVFLEKGESTGPAVKLAVASLCAVPGILLIVPFLHLALIAMPFALAPGLILLLGLLGGLLIPLFRSSAAANRWTFPGSFGAVALVFFLLAGIGSGFDKDHRQSNHVLYALNMTTQRALWISFDARPDEWTEQFFGKKPERGPLADPFPVGRRACLQAPAPVAAGKPPQAEVVEDVTADGIRHLRLRLSSPRGAERISVHIGGEVLSAAVDGKRLPANTSASGPPKNWSLYYFALPKEGIELALDTRSVAPLAVRVVDESYGLPLLDGTTFKERPLHMMPAPFFRSDFTLMSQDFSL
ncbi:MAG TPA: M20/M25/M40 family metallo-hydrolase [Chthoniobacterales bacterium]|nr:M20/M25/M40 family metallo-hydrolase [Chthoniobacterales bacterium]